MSYVTCHCAHSKDSHETGQLSCTLCECTLYRPTTADDPFKNSVQQKTVRLLAMARESDFPKTRKLGAKIEEMLGELELISEQELTYKAELARHEREREKAAKTLEEARALLAQAEEQFAKYEPPAKPKSSKYANTPKKECDICHDKFINVGAHKRFAHPDRKAES